MKDYRQFKNEVAQCLQTAPPPCGEACPFDFDFRDFIGKMKRGAFGPAYRNYANAVGFPEIVSRFCNAPCEKNCVFSCENAEIAIRLLEESAVRYAQNTKPIHYNLPVKSEKIAIIGAGLSGLACALRLCSRKYQVTIFEKQEKIGGHLWLMDPSGSFMSRIEKEFQYDKPTIMTNCLINDIDYLNADAVYIATGCHGNTFGLTLSGTGLAATDKAGCFLGGMVTGCTLMESLADGLSAARAIERYLKTGNMNEPICDRSSGCHPGAHTVSPRVIPGDTQSYTSQEAVAEASRCTQCQCDSCIQHCELMNSYRKYPPRINEEVGITIEPVSLSRNARVATRFIASCNHCGLCKEVCPKGIDVDAFLLESHRKMREKGAMPWAYHEFWLRDMQFASEEAGFFYTPKNSEKAEYVFFPGCRLSGSSPDLTERTYRFLSEQRPTGLWSDCCGAPAEWAGDTAEHQKHLAHIREIWEQYGRPKVIFACMTCMKQFSAHLPEIEGISLYEYLDAVNVHSDDCVTLKQGSVFDPCASRAMPLTQKAIRSLANRIGISLVPLPNEGDNAQCCGWGGQIEIANPGLANRIAEKRIAQSDEPYIVYCANCRDIFKRRGKQTYHILELLFAGGKKQPEAIPTWTGSRENRKKLKQAFIEQEEGVGQMEENQICLVVSPELMDRMDKNYILREDVETVIAHSEKSSCKLYDPDRDCYIGHAMIGNMTLWAEYRVVDGQYELLATYAHRMKILEE